MMDSISRPGSIGRLSLVRLDPPEHMLIARGYSEPVDANAPLLAMTEPFMTSAVVSIAGDTAYVQAAHGKLSRAMVRDFCRELARLGVRRFLERKQTPDGVVWAEHEFHANGSAGH